MDPTAIGLLSLVPVLALILLGMNIGLVFLLVAFVGIVVVTGSFEAAYSLLITSTFFTSQEWLYVTLPLFVIMGAFAAYARITSDAYKIAYGWVGRLPGGLSIATIIACAGFGGVTGSSIVDASVFTKITLPEMMKVGYDRKLASGSIASASLLANLIPPSAMAIVYGMLTKTSIAALFIAGILPGLILTLLYSLVVVTLVSRNPKLAPRSPIVVPWKEKVTSLKGTWGVGVLALIVIGGIYGGIFTATEAAGVGAFAAFLMAIVQRRLTRNQLLDAITEASRLGAVVFFILIGSLLYSRFLAMSGVSQMLTKTMFNWGLPLWAIVSAFVILYLVLGTFMDAISQMTLTLPIIFPLLTSLGADPIWLGIVVAVAAESGELSPPVGLLVTAVKAAAGPAVTFEEVFQGVMPFFIAILALLGLLIAFPEIALVLPRAMSGR